MEHRNVQNARTCWDFFSGDLTVVVVREFVTAALVADTEVVDDIPRACLDFSLSSNDADISADVTCRVFVTLLNISDDVDFNVMGRGDVITDENVINGDDVLSTDDFTGVNLIAGCLFQVFR